MPDISTSTTTSADAGGSAMGLTSGPDAVCGEPGFALVAALAPTHVADDEPRPAPRELLGKALRGLGPRRISAVYLWIAFLGLFGLLEPHTPSSYRLWPAHMTCPSVH
jgi:hypothetical protein